MSACPWKSHDWTAMDRLVDDGFIEKPKCIRKHSRVLTNEGIEKAKELLDHVGPSLGFNKKGLDELVPQSLRLRKLT